MVEEKNRKHYVVMLGFGSANQELARLILKQREMLRDEKLEIIVSGIFTRSHGGAYCKDQDGLDLKYALELFGENGSQDLGEMRQKGYKSDVSGTIGKVLELVEKGRMDTLAEGIIANYENAEPAVNFAKWALMQGINYVTANKAPIALFYPELHALATKNNCKFRFESACGDGIPIFNIARYCLPGQKVMKFEGILNTTTNVILNEMEKGKSMEDGIQLCQAQGIAEADPSGDIDGFDAAVKCLTLARVYMKYDGDMKISDIQKASLRDVSTEEVLSLAEQKKRVKYVCTGYYDENNEIQLKVEKKIIGPENPFYHVNGFDNIWTFHFSDLGSFTLTQHNGTTRDTGYGLFADILDVAGYREHP